jgi:hypothetical protein
MLSVVEFEDGSTLEETTTTHRPRTLSVEQDLPPRLDDKISMLVN